MSFPKKIKANMTDTKNNIRLDAASPFYVLNTSKLFSNIISGKEKEKNRKDPHTSSCFQGGTIQNALEASGSDHWLVTII